jgi:hypothetical protein
MQRGPRRVRQVSLRVLRVDHDGSGPLVPLFHLKKEVSFRELGEIANRTAQLDVASVDDELAGTANAPFGWGGDGRAFSYEEQSERGEKSAVAGSHVGRRIWQTVGKRDKKYEPKTGLVFYLFT